MVDVPRGSLVAKGDGVWLDILAAALPQKQQLQGEGLDLVSDRRDNNKLALDLSAGTIPLADSDRDVPNHGADLQKH